MEDLAQFFWEMNKDRKTVINKSFVLSSMKSLAFYICRNANPAEFFGKYTHFVESLAYGR